MQPESPDSKVHSLLRTSLVWDNHGCMPLRADETFLPQLERYRQSGVNVISLNAGFGATPWNEQLLTLSFMRQWIAQQPEHYRLITAVEDVHRCKSEGKLGVTFDLEGMGAVDGGLSLVQTFYELGVRWMLITYNRNNAAGGGCLDTDTGLTARGREIIAEMDRVGMVLCLSHAGARTVTEAMECTQNPAIFSHSNPYGDHPHPRNISDDLMRACARKGGVIGLSGFGLFLGEPVQLVERLLRQVRYVADLVGPEHLGLGLDYVFDRAELDQYIKENPGLFPPDFHAAAGKSGMPMIEPEALPRIVEGLSGSHFTDQEIRGILGENWLRVATQVWR